MVAAPIPRTYDGVVAEPTPPADPSGVPVFWRGFAGLVVS